VEQPQSLGVGHDLPVPRAVAEQEGDNRDNVDNAEDGYEGVRNADREGGALKVAAMAAVGTLVPRWQND
jgi:hypothetical protein